MSQMMPEHLEELLKKAKAQLDAMSPTEREAMIRTQIEDVAKAEASWPKPKFKTDASGARVYDSYEDYCND